MEATPPVIDGEEWREVPGWPGYLVSTLGRFFVVPGKTRAYKEGLRKLPWYDRLAGAYPLVYLTRGDTETLCLAIHRVVLLTFVGPCPSGHEIDHKNADKCDARLANLEYVTHGENIRRAHACRAMRGIPHRWRDRPDDGPVSR